MSKYFCGITLNKNKYSISIIDDNLNIIFLDRLDLDKLSELLKRKSISIVSVDAPLTQYARQLNEIQNGNQENIKIKRRNIDNLMNSKGFMTYQDRLEPTPEIYQSMSSLYLQLQALGFSVKKPNDTEKSIIESYPEASFTSMGMRETNAPLEETVRRKAELLRNKGIRVKNYLNKNNEDADCEANVLVQAFTAYLYSAGECAAYGTAEEGIIVLPKRGSLNRNRIHNNIKRSIGEPEAVKPAAVSKTYAADKSAPSVTPFRGRGSKVVSEYCGAQYLYTNVDGAIHINDLRPIKSYVHFTELYELKSIKQVQIIMCTIDGLRKVKANMIPYTNNSNIFRAADDEDKKKLDSFWGDHGDKHGYVVKFNKVDIITHQ